MSDKEVWDTCLYSIFIANAILYKQPQLHYKQTYIRKQKYLTLNQCCQWSNIPTFGRHLQILLCVANVFSNWFWLLVTKPSESLFEVSSWPFSFLNQYSISGRSEQCWTMSDILQALFQILASFTAVYCSYLLSKTASWNGTLFHINRSLCETLHFPLKEINLFL